VRRGGTKGIVGAFHPEEHRREIGISKHERGGKLRLRGRNIGRKANPLSEKDARLRVGRGSCRGDSSSSCVRSRKGRPRLVEGENSARDRLQVGWN